MAKFIGSGNKVVTWGAAGCGRFTENTFLPSLELAKRNQLKAVFSNDAKRAKDISLLFGADESFSNYDEFLAAPFDALYIGSRNSDHYKQVIKAAKAGKHILCEKPMAIDSDKASEMVKVCKENNVKLYLNYVHRVHPLIQKAKELMNKNYLGKVVSVSANFNIDFAPNGNFRFNKSESGGGALWDLGTHMIDLLRYLNGEIIDIKGFSDSIIYKSEVEDFTTAVVQFANGSYGHFNVSYNVKNAFNRIEILGHKGVIALDDLIAKKTGAAKLKIKLDGEALKTFRKRANKQVLFIRDFQSCLLNGTPQLVTGEDGLVNIKLMEKLES